MTGSGQDWIPDLGDKLGDIGVKSNIPENAITFSLSLLGAEIQMILCDITAYLGEYKRAVLGSQREVCVDRLQRLWSFVCCSNLKADELSAIESAVTVI
ncbi:hypothetical protein AVEN_138260-1 [Araneus ventricosus]|uniref:Uncharacterized protein n=1 Tax=Araneus ventricosus TaxID=182803 RepID=A0A4Y2KUJ5_ARAVE|nr:hypothetical protein AVEN_138260-1 [Araneus ventricosus]